MRAEATSSRLLAPSVRVNGSSAPSASTAASGPSKRSSGGSLAPPPLPTYGYGLRRPSAATSSVTSSTGSSSARRRASEDKARASGLSSAASPPKLALHELQGTQPSTPTTTFLRRGSGRTIATLGNAALATPPPPQQTSVRRKSGSPARQPSATPTRQRPRGSISKQETERRASPHYEARMETQTQQFHSPEPFLRQRKRSADMMELQAQLGVFAQDDYPSGGNAEGSTPMLTNGSAHAKREEEEVDEPPLLMLDDERKDHSLPSTPPRRGSAGAVPSRAGQLVSPPDSKRLRRLTRSPKTPLGISSYTPNDGDGLSATQRVRLSLSGYMTVASLTGQAPRDRRSLGGSGVGGLLTYSASSSATPAGPAPAQPLFPPEKQEVSAAHEEAPRSQPGSLNQSTSSQKRSKFAASRSQSGPAQVATVLLPTKQSVDCLMGYIRELQLSEATLRKQVEKTRKQKNEELSRSMVRVNSLEATMSQLEMERERERKELEEHQHLIEALKAEVAQLREYFAQQAHYEQQQQHPMYEKAQGNTSYTQEAYAGEAYSSDQSHAAGTNANEAYSSQWTATNPPQGGEMDAAELYHNGDSGNGLQQPQAWGNEHVQSESGAPYGRESTPDDGALAPGIDEYAQTVQTNYENQQDPSSCPAQEYAKATPDWAGQNAGYYGDEYQRYQQGEPTDAPFGSEWNDQQRAAHDQSYDQSGYQTQYAEAYADQTYHQQGHIYSDSTAYSPLSQPPLSPAASPQAVWNARSTTVDTAPMIDNPPPMFRIAPRLSDIISPLARSSAAGANAAVDHNVLKPVMPEALANVPEQGSHKQQRGKNTVPAMTSPQPAANGPPVFSMGDISSTFEPVPRLPTPPPSSRSSTGYQTPEPRTYQTHFEEQVIPEGPVNIEEEQFVPATQFFKPFQKLKLTNQKPPVAPLSASPTSTHVPMDILLTDFFTAVDKSKLRMVETYTTRYKGREEKLFSELSKKYGAEKVAQLKHTFEHGEAPPSQAQETSPFQTVFSTPPPPPSRTRGQVLSPQSLRVDSTSSLSPDMQAPLSPEAGGSGIFGSESPAQPFLMSAASFDGSNVDSPSTSHQTAQSTISNSPFSPPPMSVSPSHKVSPNGGRRRGPPLPFSFDEAAAQSTEEMLPVIPPPPVVSVNAPPLPPRSPAVAAPSSPPRLAPSPPREPPPRSRSPVRNVGIVRQRVSPQNRRQSSEGGTGFPPPPLGAGPAPPMPPGGKTSPVQPVTLESLLNELYRKHQPDKLKNVPAVVKEYTGKERELIAQLKHKYGAFSVKKLELNLEVLIQQRGGVSAAPSLAGVSPVAASASQPIARLVKKRGWFRRIISLLIKLIIIRFIVVLLAFGGFAALNHFQCDKLAQDTSSTDASDCGALRESVDTFDYTRFTEYVQRVESPQCFCVKWTTQEQVVWQSPSLTSTADLAKLTLFGRTIAEPVFIHFVDTYLPDLPWTEYYESYGKPAFVAAKEYYLEYLKPAIQSTKEHYEVYAKPAILLSLEYAAVGFEHVNVLLKEATDRAQELPWEEYFETHAQPMIQAAREFGAEGYEHTKVMYTELSAVVAEWWAQLVKMYEEEGGEVSARHEGPGKVKLTEDTSTPMEVLTKAAKASKSLAEPSEVELTGDAQPSNRAPTEAAVPVPADGVEPVNVAEAETTVEVTVEQSGFDVEYAAGRVEQVSSPLNTDDRESSSDTTEAIETNEISVPAEAVASELETGETMGTDVNEAARADDNEDHLTEVSFPVVDDVNGSPSQLTIEAGAVEAPDAVEVASDVPTDHSVEADESTVVEQVEVSEEVRESAIESVKEAEDAVSAENPEAAVTRPTVDEPMSSIASAPVIEETEELSPEANDVVVAAPDADDGVVSPSSQSTETTVTELEHIEDTNQLSSIKGVQAEIEIADESRELASTEVVEEVAVDIPSMPGDDSHATDQDVGDSISIAGDQVDLSDLISTRDEAGPDTSADAPHTTLEEVEASPEELAVLEDLDGLDPLEMLDMAELAAAELYTAQ